MEKQSSPTITGTFGKSLRATVRNGKLLFSIMLFVYLFLSFLEFGGDFVMKPLLKDISLETPTKDLSENYNGLSDHFDESTLKALKILLLLKLGSLLLSGLALLFFIITTISSSSAAHTAKILTLKDTVLWVRRKWVPVFITTVYMSLITVAVFSTYFILLAVGLLMMHGIGSYRVKYGLLSLLGGVFYVYLITVWVMSLVVTVVENKCSGLKAILRAGEILKGKRIKACIIMMMFVIVGTAIYTSCLFVAGKLWNEKSATASMGARLCTIWSLSFVKLFLLVVYTVFYHECKNSEIEEIEDEDEKIGLYLPVASNDV
jgi:hypothetical protein